MANVTLKLFHFNQKLFFFLDMIWRMIVNYEVFFFLVMTWCMIVNYEVQTRFLNGVSMSDIRSRHRHS